jgi:transposase-like protein
VEAAKSLFRRALRDGAHRQPCVINTDLAPTYPRAMAEFQH